MTSRFHVQAENKPDSPVYEILSAASAALQKHTDSDAKTFITRKLAHLDLDKLPPDIDHFQGRIIINGFAVWLGEIERRAEAVQ